MAVVSLTLRLIDSSFVGKERKIMISQANHGILMLLVLCVLVPKCEIGENKVFAAEVGQEAHHPIGVSRYHVVGDWTDVPLFKYEVTNGEEVFVWEDGRIAWRDTGKRNPSFFKSKIPQDVIAKALDDLVECYNRPTPLKRKSSTNLAIPLMSAPSVRCMVFSTRLHKTDSWQLPIFEKYKQDEPRIVSSNLPNALDSFSERTMADRNFNRNLKASILYFYRDLEKYPGGRTSDMLYCPNDVRDYTAMFIADATFLVLFEKTIKGLIPDDINLESKPETRSWKRITIQSTTNENGERVFVYDVGI